MLVGYRWVRVGVVRHREVTEKRTLASQEKRTLAEQLVRADVQVVVLPTSTTRDPVVVSYTDKRC